MIAAPMQALMLSLDALHRAATGAWCSPRGPSCSSRRCRSPRGSPSTSRAAASPCPARSPTRSQEALERDFDGAAARRSSAPSSSRSAGADAPATGARALERLRAAAPRRVELTPTPARAGARAAAAARPAPRVDRPAARRRRRLATRPTSPPTCARSSASATPTAEGAVATHLVGQGALWAGAAGRLQGGPRDGRERSASRSSLLILLAVFGSLAAAALPLALGVVSVLVTGALIYLLSRAMEMSVFVTNMASMIGIGVAVDYSLFVLARYREEVAAGRAPDEARGVALATSGVAVLVLRPDRDRLARRPVPRRHDRAALDGARRDPRRRRLACSPRRRCCRR